MLFGIIAASPYSLWWKQPRLGVAELLKEPAGSRSATSFLKSFVYPALCRNKCIETERDFLIRRPFNQADMIFARSAFTRHEVIDMFGVDRNKITVAYCGVDPAFTKIPRTSNNKVSKFIFYGALLREKGIFEALEAFARMDAQGYRDWTFKIAGWGDEEQVSRLARQHRISDRMVLLGRLDRSALLRELEWAQLAILPSHVESFGLAIAEAQASGLPVISYEVGAVPEVVEKDVTGWLVPVGRVDLLAEAIIEAIQDPQKTFRMGLAGRDRVNRLFSWKQTADTMLESIEQIVARKSIG